MNRAVLNVCRRHAAMALIAAVAACGGPDPQHWAALGQIPQANDEPVADEPAAFDADAEAVDDATLTLPSDRGLERDLERARRLLDRADWSSAVVAIDGILEGGSDAFLGGTGRGASRRSIRAEAMALVAALPAPARDAYQLLFRARAERALASALEAGDQEAVVAVARRWFATPAGRDAALIAAFLAIESGDLLSAAGWVERLDAVGIAGPTRAAVDTMRRLVSSSMVDVTNDGLPEVRLGGRDVKLRDVRPRAGESADWLQPGGDATRNAITAASRPLLAPRYRVPVTRHAEEARLLERRRRAAGPDEGPMMPAAGVVVVRDLIVTPTPLGILGIDFESGRRLWLQSARASVAVVSEQELQASLARVFDDATSGGLASDGASVFAVERHGPHAGRTARMAFVAGDGGPPAGGPGGTSLTAYDIAGGTVRWRLPAGAGEGRDGETWYLGAPLVVGGDLYVLVERGGRVLLDVLDAVSGTVRWSQPLADLAGDDAEGGPAATARRLAGLTPAAADGVLVCPLGGGVVVALDLATRDLLWAHRYATIDVTGEPADVAGLFRGRSSAVEAHAVASLRGRDPYPVIVRGAVLLAAYDGHGVICLGLRDGNPRWRAPARGRVHIAGAVGDRACLVSAGGVECLSLDAGRRLWQRPHPQGVGTSGRGLLTPHTILVPTDAPAVVELALADGARLGEWVTRGGAVPGNLVACRGEVVSRGLDSVDVFHQVAKLESRVETAAREAPGDAWTDSWSGQLALDRGRVADGLAALRAAAAAPVPAAATGDLVDALTFALNRDFTAAAPAWRQWHEAGSPAARHPDVLRAVVDGFLRTNDPPSAWIACRELLSPDTEGDRGALLRDPFDAALEVRPDRWLAGRLAEVVSRADPALQRAIDADAEQRLASAAGTPGGGLATTPRRRLRHGLIGGTAARPADPAEAWPFGEVVVRRQRGAPDAATVGSQIVSVPLTGASDPPVPGISIAYDVQERHLLVRDACGRRIVEPLPIEAGGSDAGLPWIGQSFPIEPSIVGRLLVVRTRGGVVAFDLLARADEPRVAWRHVARQQEPVVVGMPAVGGRVARNGAIPLGRRIMEADEAARSAIQGPPARAGGVSFATPGCVVMLDADTGEVAWERSGLRPVTEWIGDDEVLCGCTADGTRCPVLSARDGRLLREIDLPDRRQRMTAFGRHVVAIVPLDEHPLASRVRIDVIDAQDRSVRTVGEFAGESRAVPVEGERLALAEPDGRLTMIDGAAACVAWQVRLPGLGPAPDSFHVLRWQDRYLVYAAAVGGDAQAAGDDDLAPLQSMLSASESTPPLPAAVWAVAADDGRPLWSVPATVRGVGLHLAQPSGLPLLLFARQSRSENGPRLALLGLDKRTGHAVLDERRLGVSGHMFVGCEVVGDPDTATITVRGTHGTTRPVVLEYTGRPVAPRPPHQADAQPAGAAEAVRAGTGTR
ncbi:MAG: PQQ-binding-like beta-propeller repeat protein [Planctomycetaceae bacterium]